MEGVGIFDGDLLLIDRSLNVEHNSVVVATYNGQFVCKILDTINNRLCSANEEYPAIKIRKDDEFCLEGIVTSSIRLHSIPVELNL